MHGQPRRTEVHVIARSFDNQVRRAHEAQVNSNTMFTTICAPLGPQTSVLILESLYGHLFV